MTKVNIKTLKGKEEEDSSLFISAPDDVNDDFKAESDRGSDSDGDIAHSNLISDINKLNAKKRLKDAPRNVRFMTGEGGTTIDTEDILNRIGFNNLKKTTQKLQTLPEPLEKVALKRLKRASGYGKVSCEAEKWSKLVKVRRMEDQLSFPLQKTDVRTYTTLKREEIKPRTSLEKEVYSLLHGAKLIEDVKKTNEEKEKERAMSLDELKERNRLAWKEKQQRLRLERKAWMQNKSKSRKYHQLLRRDRLKKEKAELEILEKENPEAALERIEELEKARILERMSLRHKKSKWTQFQGLRAMRDESAREALQEAKSMHEELVEKRRRADSSSEDDEDEEELNEKLEALKKEKEAAVSAGLFDPSNPWTANLMQQLPQRAEAAVEDAIDDSFVNFKKFWEEVNRRKVIEKKAREVAERKLQSVGSDKGADDDHQGQSDKKVDADSETNELESGDEGDGKPELKKANLFKVVSDEDIKLKEKQGSPSDGEEQLENDLDEKSKTKKADGKKKAKQKTDSKVLGSKVKKKAKLLTDSKVKGVKAKKKVKSKKQISGDDKEKEEVSKDVKGKKTKKKLKVKAKVEKSDAEKYDSTGNSKESPKGKKKSPKEKLGKKTKKKVKKGKLGIEEKDSKSKEKSDADEDDKPASDGEVMDLEEQLVSIDNMFSQAELSLKRKLSKRLKRLGIDASDTAGWTKVDSKNSKRKRDDNEKGILPKIEEFDFTSKKDGDNIDEGTKRAKTLEDMDHLQKNTEGLDALQNAMKTLKGVENGNNFLGLSTDFKPDEEPSPKAAQVDPSKFLQVDPKVLQGAMPNSISKGDEDALDDIEDDGDAEDIIQEAFADDYLVEEFKAEKEAAIEKDKPKDVTLDLPGWGSWTGPNMKENPRRRRKFMATTPKAPPRKDANLSNVIYNEKADVHDNLRKAMVTELPYPFSRVRDFEASVRAPIGRQFVPEKEHKQLIKPPVVTKLGRIIEPMMEEELLKYEDSHEGKRRKNNERYRNNKWSDSKKQKIK